MNLINLSTAKNKLYWRTQKIRQKNRDRNNSFTCLQCFFWVTLSVYEAEIYGAIFHSKLFFPLLPEMKFQFLISLPKVLLFCWKVFAGNKRENKLWKKTQEKKNIYCIKLIVLLVIISVITSTTFFLLLLKLFSYWL